MSASSEMWEYKQGLEHSFSFQPFPLRGHAATSVLQFSLMGEHLAAETALSPGSQNTLVLGAILLSFTEAQTRSNAFVLDGIALM